MIQLLNKAVPHYPLPDDTFGYDYRMHETFKDLQAEHIYCLDIYRATFTLLFKEGFLSDFEYRRHILPDKKSRAVVLDWIEETHEKLYGYIMYLLRNVMEALKQLCGEAYAGVVTDCIYFTDLSLVEALKCEIEKYTLSFNPLTTIR